MCFPFYRSFYSRCKSLRRNCHHSMDERDEGIALGSLLSVRSLLWIAWCMWRHTCVLSASHLAKIGTLLNLCIGTHLVLTGLTYSRTFRPKTLNGCRTTGAFAKHPVALVAQTQLRFAAWISVCNSVQPCVRALKIIVPHPRRAPSEIWTSPKSHVPFEKTVRKMTAALGWGSLQRWTMLM